MSGLAENLEELDRLIQGLQRKHELCQQAAAEFTARASDGSGDLAKLATKLQKCTQEYEKSRTTVSESLKGHLKQLHAEVTRERERGVDFPKHPFEKIALATPEQYGIEKLCAMIESVKAGIIDLNEAVKQFEATQIAIQISCSRLETEIARLRSLEELSDQEIASAELIATHAADAHQPRAKVLEAANTLLIALQTRANDGLRTQILTLRQQLADLESRAARIQVSFPPGSQLAESEDLTIDTWLSTSVAPPVDPLEHAAILDAGMAPLSKLQTSTKLLNASLVQKVEGLLQRIDQLRDEARTVLANSHPQMPEAIDLKKVLALQSSIKEADLPAYANQLTAAIDLARKGGINALDSYRARVAADDSYVFADNNEIELIGTSLLAVATRPEQYSGPLWMTGEEILLRLMIGGADTSAFFERFGFGTVVRALQAALEHEDVPNGLAFLDTEFLPPTGSSHDERIRTLLAHPQVREMLQQAIVEGKLLLKPENIENLTKRQLKSLLTLIEHADDVSLPDIIILQWSAILHDRTSRDSPIYEQTAQLLAMALLRAKRYIGLYYTLEALEPTCPQLWEEPGLRPMLWQVAQHAFKLGIEGRSFLIGFAKNSAVRRLAKGEFGYEFLLSAICHYVAVRWGETSLFNETWGAWDALAEHYPVLSGAMKHQIEGKEIMLSEVEDRTQLLRSCSDLLSEINARFTTPGFQGVRLAGAIYRWYVDEHMRRWTEQLANDQLGTTHVHRIQKEISALQQEDDLVDACPLQQKTRPQGAERHYIEGRLKDKINNRLFELLDLFQEAIRFRLQLAVDSTVTVIPGKSLLAEFQEIRTRSEEAAWAIDQLIIPELHLQR